MIRFIKILVLAALVSWNVPANAFIRGGSPTAGCTTNGSDGQAAAPTGTGQFPALLAGYATTPPWCAAGVGYAVGISTNASVSGSTITETGNVVIPVNNDKKSFYPSMQAGWPASGSIPGGLTTGTAYFLCNVTNVSGSTYSYTLSTSTACGAPVTLSGTPPAFVALKIPGSTTNTPANTSGWNSVDCGFGATFYICITGNNVTLDHWDFANNGGWGIFPGVVSSPTVTNNYFLAGTNARGFFQDEGNTPTNVAFSNNVLDGNAVPVTTTASGTVGSGSSSFAVSSSTGIRKGMTVCDITHAASTTCPQSGTSTRVTSIVGSTISISPNTSGIITSGDTISFIQYPNPDNTEGGSPQIAFGDQGSTVAQYNWIRNTCSEHWAEAFITAKANLGLSLKYNVLENTGWCEPITGAHGDVVQLFGVAGSSFQTITLNYNTIIQNNAQAPAGTTTFSILFSGTFGATATVANVQNNTAIYSVAGGVSTSTDGLTSLNTSWFSSSVNVTNNYVDPTSACDGAGGNCGAASWNSVAPGNGGGTGPSSPTCAMTGNVNLVNNTTLAKPTGTYAGC